MNGEDLLLEYGLTTSCYIIAVGRLVPEKGFDVLIEAFKRLNLRNWKLVIVGSADHEGAYSQQLKEKGRKVKNIVFTGYLNASALDQLYRHAGLFVLPSYYEGLPITLLEALRHGLSCIVSDIQGNRSILLDEDRYFEPGNCKALAEKIQHYVNRPLSSDEKSIQRLKIERTYNWEAIAARTLDVYREVLGVQPSFVIKATSVG